jgi:hypothetical protein
MRSPSGCVVRCPPCWCGDVSSLRCACRCVCRDRTASRTARWEQEGAMPDVRSYELLHQAGSPEWAPRGARGADPRERSGSITAGQGHIRCLCPFRAGCQADGQMRHFPLYGKWPLIRCLLRAIGVVRGSDVVGAAARCWSAAVVREGGRRPVGPAVALAASRWEDTSDRWR